MSDQNVQKIQDLKNSFNQIRNYLSPADLGKVMALYQRATAWPSDKTVAAFSACYNKYKAESGPNPPREPDIAWVEPEPHLIGKKCWDCLDTLVMAGIGKSYKACFHCACEDRFAYDERERMFSTSEEAATFYAEVRQRLQSDKAAAEAARAERVQRIVNARREEAVTRGKACETPKGQVLPRAASSGASPASREPLVPAYVPPLEELLERDRQQLKAYGFDGFKHVCGVNVGKGGKYFQVHDACQRMTAVLKAWEGKKATYAEIREAASILSDYERHYLLRKLNRKTPPKSVALKVRIREVREAVVDGKPVTTVHAEGYGLWPLSNVQTPVPADIKFGYVFQVQRGASEPFYVFGY